MTPATRMDLTAMREAFRQQADEAFDQMFGTDGQNGLVTFTEREARACEVTDDLARWLMIKLATASPLRRTCGAR